MKPSSIFLAFGFLLVVLLIALGVWFVQLISTGASGTPTERGFFGTLFPFGSGGTTATGGAENRPGEVFSGPVPQLRKVSEAPVAGAGFATGMSGVPSIRYLERETGHIYETPLDALTSVRVTNTTIPGVHDAHWINASTTLLRLLGEGELIDNFVGFFTGTSTDQELKGAFLKQYRRVALQSGELIVGALEGPGGVVVESVQLDGNRARSHYSSPISSWIPLASGGKYFVLSAPSGLATGSLFDVSGSHPVRVTGGIRGLLALGDQSGKRFLLSSGGQNGMRLLVHDALGTRELPLTTLADKCAWVPDTDFVLCGVPRTLPGGLYPDDWLLGRVAFDDELWLINIETGTAAVILDPNEVSGAPMDVYKISVTTDGLHALFVNKSDQLLWVVQLTPQ